MDNNDEKVFQVMLKEYKELYFKSIEEDIKNIWKETIQTEVYDVRSPSSYKRTEQLKDKVTSKIIGDTLYVYADTENMVYRSYGEDNINPEKIVHFIDVGHDLSSPFEGDYDFFNHYPARFIIEKFADRVRQKYPHMKIQVYRDTIL